MVKRMINTDYISYKDTGVDIDYGDESVKHMKPEATKTHRPGVLHGIGGFAGLFALKDAIHDIEDPVLVSGTDGVGTKLLVAIEANRHEEIGQDLVAMCVNDVLCTGAKPLFFLDYFAAGSLSQSPLIRVIKSIAKACESINCVLIGGESAEMPGLYASKHYDLAGFCVGAVERKKIVDGTSIKPGDQIIGLLSSGLHSNGFSLARHIFFKHMKRQINEILSKEKGISKTVADLLLEPTKLYVNPILKLLQEKLPIKAMAHITGGGITGNLLRPFPKGLSAIVDTKTWKEPLVFSLLRKHGPVLEEEMRKTFNLGIGFALIISKENAAACLHHLTAFGETAIIIGQVVEKESPVQYLE